MPVKEINYSQKAEQLWEKLMKGVNEKPIHKNPESIKTKILLNEIKEIAKQNNSPTRVVFGTSGWRGIVGISHTIQNMLRVTTGLVELVKNANKKLLKSLGINNFEEFKQRGVIVGRDNRILGKEFAEAVISVLQQNNIKVYYADEAPTPEYSTAVLQLNAAMSINLTPSHNPGCYSGYKINPADGGPAGEDITVPLEKNSNSYMNKIIKFKKVNWKIVKKIDTKKLYLKHIKENIFNIIDIKNIIKFIKEKNISIAIDHIHGATRKRPKTFLKLTGKETNIKLIHEEDNVLFHGVKPEPSSKNMKSIETFLKKQKTKFKLGGLIDPDGDRIRFTNGTNQIDMNNFGALAFHFLANIKNSKGGVAKTVATSNFVNSIASGLNKSLYETNVGFKYFRPYLKKGTRNPVVCAFEESDGFSIGHANILEKDAFGAFLIAIEIIRVTGKDIFEYLTELKNEFGTFESAKSAVDISPELSAQEKNKKIIELGREFKVNGFVNINKIKKKIINIYPNDGIKVEFNDKSNLLIRASGTEPIIKVYAESPINQTDCNNINEFGNTLVKKYFK